MRQTVKSIVPMRGEIVRPSPKEIHLALYHRTLAPAARWSPRLSDWGLFRVNRGTVSLHGLVGTRGLATGDVVALAVGAEGTFCGRGMGGDLDYCLVSLEQLTGVLTWSERQTLRAMARNSGVSTVHLTEADEASVEFSRLCNGCRSGNAARWRCDLLGLFVDLFSNELARPRAVQPGLARAAARVEALLRRLPESAVMGQSLKELARQCGCSERHFSRLFRDHCGMSVRTRQVQLRLEMAGQLLRESDAKVIHVAMESGYRHLGLFNTMFKKRFGMTPGAWRQEHLVNHGLSPGCPAGSPVVS